MKHTRTKFAITAHLLLTALFGTNVQLEAQNIVRMDMTDGTHLDKVVGEDMRLDIPQIAGQEVVRLSTDKKEDFTKNLKEVTALTFSEATDLVGESNCFIVSKPGTYSFVPTLVDGTEVENIVRADWLWREKSEEQLISDVSYSDGRIIFKAGKGKGNAVIAAANANNTIVWVWHIWLTDQPQDMLFSSTDVYVMDRNLGAVSAREEDGRDTWGLTYQYGRSVPFYYIGDNQEYYPKESFDQARKFTEVNPSFGQSWGIEISKTPTGYTVEEAMARPMTHLMRTYTSGSKGGYHWTTEKLLNECIWGDEQMQEKTNYDPCPRGYKVPFYTQLADLQSLTWDPTQQGNMQYPVSGFYVDTEDGRMWWPMVCGRNVDDGCALYGGEAKEYSDRLFLWTAFAGYYAPNRLTIYDYMPLRILVENNYQNSTLRLYYPTMGAGAFSHVVRCVRDGLPNSSVQHYGAGQKAADLTLTLADGSECSLRQIVERTDYTLLYFNNPDCSACRHTQDELQHSTALQQMQREGRLQVVSLYTDEEPELWRAHTSDYPATWTVAMDAQQRVLREGLYDMSTTPSLYLLDKEGRVVQANTTINNIEQIRK